MTGGGCRLGEDEDVWRLRMLSIVRLSLSGMEVGMNLLDGTVGGGIG